MKETKKEKKRQIIGRSYDGPRMRRPCTRCEKYFIPKTKHSKLCDECYDEAMSSVRRRLRQNASR